MHKPNPIFLRRRLPFPTPAFFRKNRLHFLQRARNKEHFPNLPKALSEAIFAESTAAMSSASHRDRADQKRDKSTVRPVDPQNSAIFENSAFRLRRSPLLRHRANN